jgi:hypothetical protein
MKQPMSTWKKIVLMHVTWAGGMIFAWFTGPHPPLWVWVMSGTLAYAAMFYIWIWHKASKTKTKSAGTTFGTTGTVIIVGLVVVIELLLKYLH